MNVLGIAQCLLTKRVQDPVILSLQVPVDLHRKPSKDNSDTNTEPEAPQNPSQYAWPVPWNLDSMGSVIIRNLYKFVSAHNPAIKKSPESLPF
ncbi:hypothetical protein OJ996_23050 [Luteolibacter sp. GHJ8]|uniref:Uncharacterized protein n=1 Tax=Luteolibacter rhizosphaerae TaxID=2989719 RepID=A0ABT3GAH1_9BACT|nr:hypothetical protein [Luteolibacter rhizosphaerae]MCW1916484.1 hypothetical protein [Luteolibacter rhizosphaerae]